MDVPKITNDVSAREITSLSGLPAYSNDFQGVAGGHFSAEPHILYNIEPDINDDDKNGYCYGFKRVEVEVNFQNPTIRVAREIPPGTCSYQTVIDHEMRHYEATREALNKAEERLRQDFNELVPPMFYRGIKELEPVQNALYKKIYDLTDVQIKDLFTEIAQRNAQIDTIQESLRVSGSCNGEVVHYIEQGLR
jgi:hypothetical protein